MAKVEKLTYCVAKGSRVWMQDGTKWIERAKTPKVACGRLLRLRRVGNAQIGHDLAILKVRGVEFGTHPRNLKLVGRG
jgi:hypothetical protein